MDIPITTNRSQGLGECQKLLAREGNWTCVNEVLGWNINTEVGTVALPERKLQELLTLVDIPVMQRHMVQKNLESLLGELLSMHLVVPGVVIHQYHTQRALSQGGWNGPGCFRNFLDK